MVHVGSARALGSVIAAAEAASPVEAVESVTRELGRALEASEVSFLIADLSGRALVRLAHVPLRPWAGGRPPLAQGERRDAEESATVVPFDGGPEEEAIRVQQVRVLKPEQQAGSAKRAGDWRVLAPVTERGEAIGLLELFLPSEPGAETVAEVPGLVRGHGQDRSSRHGADPGRTSPSRW